MTADNFLLSQRDYDGALAGIVIELRAAPEIKPDRFFYPEGTAVGSSYTHAHEVAGLVYACAQLEYLEASQNGTIQGLLSPEERFKKLISDLKNEKVIKINPVMWSSFLENPKVFVELTPKHLVPRW